MPGFVAIPRIIRPVLAAMMLLAALLPLAGFAVAQDASPTASPVPSGSASGANGASEVTQQIPPADLPSGNQRGYDLRIDALLKADLSKAPQRADVYKLTAKPLSKDETAALAKALGISGDVEDRGNDTYAVSGNGDLFVSPLLTQYLSNQTPTLAKLPGDDEAIGYARDWLRNVDLAPADLGDGKVSSRTEAVGRVTVTFAPAQPANILAAYPNITVVVGSDGAVLEAAVRWADISLADHYLLRTADSAWKDVEKGNAYIEAAFGDPNLDVGSVVEGKATYTQISLAYTTGGTPGSDQYLEPVFVFSGKLQATRGTSGTTDIKAYVPAIVTQNTPVG